MLFNSGVFVVLFLPLVVIGYYSINKLNTRKEIQWDLIWLFLSSLIFYGYEKPKFVFLIVLSILCNYIFTKGMKIFTTHKSSILIIGLFFNFGLLFYFKYFNFFMENLCALTHKDWTWKNIVLPLGISFFTFQQVSYIIDFYRNKGDMKYSFWEYAAFVSFFPQLVAGPIVLHSELIPQFRDTNKKNINYDNLCQGLYVFTLGLSKKVLLADTLSKIVNIGFRDVELINTGTGIVVMLAYTLQIYFDFSGYCDMAIGIAKMFNIVLPINFYSPYKAGTIGEFWKRWHITLTRFFTNYVYIPLGGNRKGIIRTLCNTFVIFLLSGLWHGANWTFIIWGALHGSLMVIEKLFCGATKRISVQGTLFLKMIYRIFVLLFINVTWMIFRADSIYAVIYFFRGLRNGEWIIQKAIYDKINGLFEFKILSRLGFHKVIDIFPCFFLLLLLLGCCCGVFFLKNTTEKIEQSSLGWEESLITVVLFLWCVFSFSEVGEFLYFNF